ncbi:MAG: ABC transporter substrate-binding protein [bacterium]|nr:ABC transporter substrate-binding protein [bacterium]
MKFVARRKALWIVMIVLLALSGTVMAQDAAPEGVFLGGWPYTLPPEAHLNSFSAGGPQTNLGIYHDLVEMPSAMYVWAEERYEPFLAESFGYDDDNNYVVTLAADATWSDGTPVTADDLIATYAIGRILGFADFTYIDYLERVDDKTVRFVMKTPSAVGERLILKTRVRAAATYGELAERATALYDGGATSDSAEWQALLQEIRDFRPESLLVSGPYTFTLDAMGDSFISLPWQPNSNLSDAVNFGEIRLWNGETEAVTPLFLNQDIAYGTYGFPPATEASFLDAGLRIIRGPQYSGPAIYFNHSEAPWNIQEVRQAMAYVIDRAPAAFLGKGLSARPVQYLAGFSDNLVVNWLSEEDLASLNTYAVNLDEATALLESVGFSLVDGVWQDAEGNPLAAEIIFPAEFADWVGGVQSAVDQLNAFGFQITPRAVPAAEQEQATLRGEFQLSVRNWGIGSPFPNSTFNQPFLRYNYTAGVDGEPGFNFPMQFEWDGEQVDLTALIAESGAGLDRETQVAAVTQIARIFNDTLPLLPLYETYTNNPLNESLVSGAPADDAPIWVNGGGDNFAIILIATGVLAPAS